MNKHLYSSYRQQALIIDGDIWLDLVTSYRLRPIEDVHHQVEQADDPVQRNEPYVHPCVE